MLLMTAVGSSHASCRLARLTMLPQKGLVPAVPLMTVVFTSTSACAGGYAPAGVLAFMLSISILSTQ